MKGGAVKIDDIRVGSGFDMQKLLLRAILLTKNIYISETELHALTYFVINGFSVRSKEYLVDSKIMKNKNAVANLVHSLGKAGIIIKTNKGKGIHPDFNINISELDILKLELMIKK